MWTYKHTLPNELYHWGIKGMKWGKRKANYDDEDDGRRRERSDEYEYRERTTQEKHEAHLREYGQRQYEVDEAQRAATRKKVAIGIAAVAALGLVAYGVSKSKSKSNSSSNNGDQNETIKKVVDRLSDGKSYDTSNEKSGLSLLKGKSPISGGASSTPLLSNAKSLAEGKRSISGGKGSGSGFLTDTFKSLGDIGSLPGAKSSNSGSKRNNSTATNLFKLGGETPVKGLQNNTAMSQLVEKLLYGHPRSKPAK